MGAVGLAGAPARGCDQLIVAGGIIAETTIDLVGITGRQVLNHLLPHRRCRTTPRVVKRAISKHVAHTAGGRIPGPSQKATISIDVLGDPTWTPLHLVLDKSRACPLRQVTTRVVGFMVAWDTPQIRLGCWHRTPIADLVHRRHRCHRRQDDRP